MRVTHTAGGYTAIDPTCPMFIRGDTVFIPTVFVSWKGQVTRGLSCLSPPLLSSFLRSPYTPPLLTIQPLVMTWQALDEKTPLLRAMKVCSDEGTRLLGKLNFNVKGIQPNIGLEQEFFLIPREVRAPLT